MASPTTPTRPRTPQRHTPQATASSVEVPCSATSRPHATPLAVATPMRTPVKEPGPVPVSTASSCSRFMPHWASMPSITLTSCSFACRRHIWSALAIISKPQGFPASSTSMRPKAQASMSVEVSTARMFHAHGAPCFTAFTFDACLSSSSYRGARWRRALYPKLTGKARCAQTHGQAGLPSPLLPTVPPRARARRRRHPRARA